MKAFSVIKKVVRGLKYQQLKSVIESRLRIETFDSIEKDVQQLFYSKGFNYVGDLQEPVNEGALKKYWLLDLEFNVIPPMPEPETVKLRFLKEYGFLTDTADLEDSDSDGSMLNDLVEDMEKDVWTVKVRLDDPTWQSEVNTKGGKEVWMSYDAKTHFPRDFVVKDACLTNCRLVWLWYHFYL